MNPLNFARPTHSFSGMNKLWLEWYAKGRRDAARTEADGTRWFCVSTWASDQVAWRLGYADAMREVRDDRSNAVIRWVATFVDKDGMRTLMQPAQGRYTYATKQEALEFIETVQSNNSPERIASVWGKNPRFKARECECWPGHFDPKGIYFESRYNT